MIEPAKLANLDQITTVVPSVVANGGAAGCRAIDVRVWQGIDVRVLPDRGLDVTAAWFAGVPLAWISTVGECPALPVEELTERRWSEAWPGGLLTTCGLSNVGAPSQGHGLHGTYTSRPAEHVHTERSVTGATVTATIVDPPFRLERRLSTALGRGLLRIDDRVVNASDWTAAAPMLYHVNIGAPVWDEGAWLETDAIEVAPRDEDAAAGLETWDVPPEPLRGAPERVFEHVGATWARLTSPRTGVEVTIRSSFQRLHQWVHPASGTYALGIEPANCSILGREADIDAGRMPLLDPGEARESWLTIEARSIE